MATVQEYLDKHKLSQLLEESVNAAVRSRAEDPVLFISNYMRKLTVPCIKRIHGRQIIDSRGNPAVEVDVITTRGTFRASSATGMASVTYGAVEDGDASRYHGRGVSRAVENVNTKIAAALIGRDPRNQADLDRIMKEDLDGTENKEKLGANAILAVSLAICKAGAAESELPLYQYIAELAGSEKIVLPVPAFNVLSGGKHAGNRLAFQEVLILPIGAGSFREAVRMGTEVYHHLQAILLEKYGQSAVSVGEEGAFAPPVSSPQEALSLVTSAVERSGHAGKVKFGLDVAASEFATGADLYDLDSKDPEKSKSKERTGLQLVELYRDLCSEFPIVSIEDPFDQNDFDNSKALTQLNICQVVGDDLLGDNLQRVSIAVENEACSALLLKLNQAGTVTEAIELARLARDAQWGLVASHRSEETEDSFLADFAVGVNAGQVKAGAPCRGERLAKYNQLLRIEEEMGERAVYAGENWRPQATKVD